MRRRLLATSTRVARLQRMTGAAEEKSSRAKRPFGVRSFFLLLPRQAVSNLFTGKNGKGIAKNASFLFPGNFFLSLPCESGVLFQVSKESVELDGGTVHRGQPVGEELVSCSTDLREICVLTVAVFGPPL